MRLKRRTRIAVQIEEKLLVRSHQGGNAAVSPATPASVVRDCLSLFADLQKEGQIAPGSTVTNIKEQKEEPSCKEEPK